MQSIHSKDRLSFVKKTLLTALATFFLPFFLQKLTSVDLHRVQMEVAVMTKTTDINVCVRPGLQDRIVKMVRMMLVLLEKKRVK